MGRTESSNAIVYTYTLNPGQTVPAGTNWLTGAQFGGNGTPHATSGDTYTELRRRAARLRFFLADSDSFR